MADRIYTGIRNSKASVSVEVSDKDSSHPLSPRLDLREHSTTLEWGYGMGGPAQLALAILADVTGSDDYAERHHHWFKLEIVSKLPWNGWEIPESNVWAWINEHHPLSSS